jgi:Mce-associated membrane protein
MARHVAPAGTKLNASVDTDSQGDDLAPGAAVEEAPRDADATVGDTTAEVAADPEQTDDVTDAVTAGEETDAATSADENDDSDITGHDASTRKSRLLSSPIVLGAILGMVMVLALGALGGWLGWGAYEAHRSQQVRSLFLQAGRQGALNLTTISVNTVDVDVQRIISSSAGAFRDNFQKRAQPFIDVVKQAQSQSQGTITEAGLESVSGDEAQVLVAVTVKTSNAGAPEQDPRSWRMRISVKKEGDDVKVSNVEFVP